MASSYVVVWFVFVFAWAANFVIRVGFSALLPPIIREFDRCVIYAVGNKVVWPFRALPMPPAPYLPTAKLSPPVLFDAATVPLLAHVDEVVDDHSTEVAQPELAGDFLGRGQVQAKCGFFGVIVRPEIAAVDVNRDEGLSLLDHDRAAIR